MAQVRKENESLDGAYVVSAGSVRSRVFFPRPGSGKCTKNQV